MSNNATLHHLAYVNFNKDGSAIRGIYLQRTATEHDLTTFERNGFPRSEKWFMQDLRENGVILSRLHRGGFSSDPSVNFDFEWSRYRSMGYTHQLCKGIALPVLFEEPFEDETGFVELSDFRDAYPDPVSLIEPVMGYKLYWFCLEPDLGRPRYIGMRQPNAAVWVELMESVRMGFHTLPDSRQLAENQVWQVREEKAWKVGAHWENYLPKEEPLPHALTYHDACLAAVEIEIKRHRR